MAQYIAVTDETKRLLDAHTITGVCAGGRQCEDGTWLLVIDDEIAGRLAAIDPDVDVAIRQACAGQIGRA